MKNTTNSIRIIKNANTHLIMDAIRKEKSVTIDSLIRITHLSRPTVLNVIENLSRRNIIEQIGYAESSVGRHPLLYAFNTSQYFAFGIDFEFPPVHLTVCDLSGNSCYEKNWDCAYDMSKKEIIHLLVEEIRKALEILGITCENILGIGLGIPGTVNIQENMSEIISRIPEWNKTPLNTILNEYFPVPIYVRNDAHLMALAVQQELKPTYQNFMYIAYRTGIGMAILRNGKLFEGEFGNSGYIGHTTVDINGDLCSCGQRGCLETFASKTTIENKYAQAKNLRNRISFDDILLRASNEDRTAIDILKTAGRYFGIVLANSVKMLDICTIILDDLNCDKNHIFIQSIEETVNCYCSSYVVQPVNIIIRPCKPKYALGAALFVLDNFFSEPKLKVSI